MKNSIIILSISLLFFFSLTACRPKEELPRAEKKSLRSALSKENNTADSRSVAISKKTIFPQKEEGGKDSSKEVKDSSKEGGKDSSKEVKDSSKEEGKETTKEGGKDSSKEVKDSSKEGGKDSSKEVKDSPKDGGKETTKEGGKDSSKEVKNSSEEGGKGSISEPIRKSPAEPIKDSSEETSKEASKEPIQSRPIEPAPAPTPPSSLVPTPPQTLKPTPPQTLEPTPSLPAPVPSPMVPLPLNPEPEPAPSLPAPVPPTVAPLPEPKAEATPLPAPRIEGKSIVFAEGVTKESGWYDVNKKGRGDNGDINMCWAASASNIIQWWQDRYQAAGHTLPNGAVSGKGTVYELALMELYHKEWNNSKGGQIHHAITWYFEGRNILKEATQGSNAQPLQGKQGGYYKDIWKTILPHLYHDYKYVVVPGVLEYGDLISKDFGNYTEWGNGSALKGEERLRHFSSLVVQFMKRGIVSMTIALRPNYASLHHSTTLWGYEIDHKTGLLTKVWITDSDDMTKDPKKEILHEYTVGLSDYGSIKLSGAPYGACYVVSLFPVSGYKKEGGMQ